mgnify:CR=1 FL=1
MPNSPYRVVASAPSRNKYPLYKFYTNPEDWHCNGTVKVSCKDGKVDVTIFEKDSINVHKMSIWSDDAPVTVRLKEELDPVQE